MRFYHKATLGGTLALLEEFDTNEPLCLSTDYSNQLFWRDVCIVLETDIEPTEYETEDIGNKASTYDEARIYFPSRDEFLNSIKYIIVDGTNPYAKGDIGDYRSWLSEFSDLDAKTAGVEMAKYLIRNKGLEDWGVKMLTITEARKIEKRWGRYFLNIER